MMRWSALSAVCSMKGMVKYRPGPFERLNLPKRSTTIFSHCMAMCTDISARQAKAKPTSTTHTVNAPVIR